MKTNKQKCSELMNDLKKLQNLNSSLRKDVYELQNVLAEEIPVQPYEKLLEKIKSFEYALKMIKYGCNAANPAWEIADSVLRKYE